MRIGSSSAKPSFFAIELSFSETFPIRALYGNVFHPRWIETKLPGSLMRLIIARCLVIVGSLIRLIIARCLVIAGSLIRLIIARCLVIVGSLIRLIIARCLVIVGSLIRLIIARCLVAALRRGAVLRLVAALRLIAMRRLIVTRRLIAVLPLRAPWRLPPMLARGERMLGRRRTLPAIAVRQRRGALRVVCGYYAAAMKRTRPLGRRDRRVSVIDRGERCGQRMRGSGLRPLRRGGPVVRLARGQQIAVRRSGRDTVHAVEARA